MSARAPAAVPPEHAAAQARATGLGLGAVLLWAALAALTTLAGPVPPFQLAAMTFALGTLVGLVWAAVRRQSLAGLASVPAGAWALGVYGLLAFHVCYFLALRHAPALEASLIVYLWPLLIVLFSGFLPRALGGRRLGWPHIVGALLGLAGAAVILAGGSGSGSNRGAGLGAGPAMGLGGHALGYALAMAAALIWASYSVASRVYLAVPSTSVIGACAATAVGATLLHLALEVTSWPSSPSAWLAVLGLGLGPVGLAFYLWDEGMKRGDMRLLGVASYATPLLSTLLLALLGLGRAHAGTWLAALLVTVGALLASHPQWLFTSAAKNETPRP